MVSPSVHYICRGRPPSATNFPHPLVPYRQMHVGQTTHMSTTYVHHIAYHTHAFLFACLCLSSSGSLFTCPSASGSPFTPLSVPVLPSTLLPLLLLVLQDRACSSLPFLPLSVFLFSDQVKKLCPAPPPRSAARPSGDRRALRRTGAPRRVVSPGSRPQDNKTRSWDSRPDGARGGVRA